MYYAQQKNERVKTHQRGPRPKLPEIVRTGISIYPNGAYYRDGKKGTPLPPIEKHF